ncbi:hypothetical protein DPEC_G00185750 [Dallia pectoralis]|uniref:Uncharacterized protein n=1 Tax=Dallia pectoralis TaxID=75939 RepID=A0ACC2GBG7_DALPE|nr:hypothetical protein DPEC_G00185750 [Dallia pectoralis]
MYSSAGADNRLHTNISGNEPFLHRRCRSNFRTPDERQGGVSLDISTQKSSGGDRETGRKVPAPAAYASAVAMSAARQPERHVTENESQMTDYSQFNVPLSCMGLMVQSEHTG